VVRTLGAFNRFKSFVLTQPPQHLAQDIRASCGRQGFVADAPVNFVYVADFSKMGAMGDDDKILYSAAATGFVIQNVYLFCSANGLATVVRGSIDRPTLVRKMNLQNDQRIILARTIGYPG
jgi:nitroreductase